MQTLYGVRITDRVTVEHRPADDMFVGKFDGEVVTGRARSGASAVRAVQEWLNNRAKLAAVEAEREAKERAERKEADEREFITEAAGAIGLTVEDLDRLLDIAARRAAKG